MYTGQNSINDTFGFYLNRFGYVELFNSLSQNNKSYFLFMQRFLNYFCNCFEYKNLPEETQKMTNYNNNIERYMFFAPALSIFKDDVMGIQVLPVSAWDGKRDINGLPKEWAVDAGNGYRKKLNNKNAVLMFNDMAMTVPFIHILYETSFMVDLDNTHRQNIYALRQPLIMEITEDEKKSAAKFVNDLTEFKSIIKVRVKEADKLSKNQPHSPFNMTAFNSTVQPMGDQINKDFVTYENRVFTYIGLNNVTFEKKERMLTGELSQNDQVVQSNFTNRLICRQNAWDIANKMFGCNVKVKPRQYFAPETMQVNTQSQNYMGGKNNGSVSADSNVPAESDNG